MSSLNNINNNSSVINVGRTTPVNPGPQPANKSIPVVVATDQSAIPVEEQNKIQSEVALSLLGIPRSEVALGIFADVNTYDVNPSEWSNSPEEYEIVPNTSTQYTGIPGDQGWGIKHLPEESGAMVTAPADETAVLTSKRFFRYQPGRVSAATFGIKNSVYPGNVLGENQRAPIRNPSINKYGIFDKFDGYYWETRDTAQGDQFAVVRRTQSILRNNPLQFGNQAGQQLEDHALGGKPPASISEDPNEYPTSTSYLSRNRIELIENNVISNVGVKCKRDLGFFIDAVGFDVTLGTNYNAVFQAMAETNSAEYPGTDATTPEWQNVIDNTEATRTAIKALSGVDSQADTRVDAFYNKLAEIAFNESTRLAYADSVGKIAELKSVTFSNPTSGATASEIAVKDRIQANYDFIIEDVINYVENNFTTPTGYSADKCRRDVLFAVNAAIYDILYGGTTATYDAAKFFVYDGFDKSDQTGLDILAQTVGAYDHLISIIDDIVTNNAISAQAGNTESQDTSGTAADSEEAVQAQTLIGYIRAVINNGDIIIKSTGEDILPTRTLPDSSWADNSYTTAQQAIQENKEDIIDNIVTITFSGDDLKCIRDLDFAIDAYINDLQWGGDAHTIVNATTYDTALLLDAEREGETHWSFRNALRDALNAIGETEAAKKIGVISAYQLQAVTQNGSGKYPAKTGPDGTTTGSITNSQISNADYGNRAKIDTIFSVYDKYYAYLVSESIDYTLEVDGVTYDEDVLKFKCLRDTRYILGAYASDLQYGGNAATVYNAKKYYSDGELKVFSQADGAGVVGEIARHQYLQQLLISNSNVTVTLSDDSTVSIPSLYSKFNLSTAQRDKLESLSNIVINNFTTEYTGAIDYGDAGQWGDLVILRDGLIMVHAGVFDPSLLKPKKRVISKADPSNNSITMTEGSVIIGQYVNYYGNAGGLVDGKTYYVANVSGPKSNIIQLVDPMAEEFDETAISPSNFTPIDITDAGTESFIETPVPFIFPKEYSESFGVAGVEERYDGLFPYLYSSSGVLPAESTDSTIGFIDTAIDTSTNPSLLRSQIDDLNYKYKTWVRDHVDPEFYSVYEYRVGRSRFSGDTLAGNTRPAVYSDNVLDNKAGETFTQNGQAVEQVSVWDLDFSKVTMLKIEFSWYGAVGALFLAYVPVGNGEARWVRVHHLRCSNQLKISSLGNATLPITYLVYGGGSQSRFGIANDERLPNAYGTYSEFLVKYGASYYIDGGDRGTVRLYNHSSDTPTDIYGSRFTLGVDASNAQTPYNPYITVNDLDPNSTGSDAPSVSTFYMSGRVITGNSQDQAVRIIWQDGDKLYLNKPITSVSQLDIIVDRPALMYGLKTKDNILSGEGNDVRNRVQVYPTRLSVGAEGNTNAKMTLYKTPKFQTLTPTFGSFSANSAVDLNESYKISTSNEGYLSENGQSIWGYFQATLNGSTSFVNVLGRLTKEEDEYFFVPADIYNGTLVIENGATFLKEGIFDAQGNELSLNNSEVSFEKERLSSVEVSLRAQTPIPGSGTELASYYISPGAQDFDLATYFDYNKEYISYPLTDQLETLYLATFSNQSKSSSSLVSLSASLTWEEQ